MLNHRLLAIQLHAKWRVSAGPTHLKPVGVTQQEIVEVMIIGSREPKDPADIRGGSRNSGKGGVGGGLRLNS